MWYVKIPIKIILTRLPISYQLFRRIGLFRHGDMDSASYAISVFLGHLERARARGLPAQFTAMEFGPGDSVAAALLARAAGAGRVYLVDAGKFASRDMAVYRQVARNIESAGLEVPTGVDLEEFDSFLKSCGALYLTGGLSDLRALPSESVDFIWSQAVLEHIRLRDFPAVLAEMRRIMRPTGVCSHRVDLRDHLAGGLNNLRFPQSIWESDFMARSGFYTNRIGFRQMLSHFETAGFSAELLGVEEWPAAPIKANAMRQEFRLTRQEDIRVSGFDVVLRPKSHPVA